MRRLLLLLAVGACHGKHGAGKDYFGTQLSPPGILAQIRPGMTLAQVKAIAPDAKTEAGKGLWLASPASDMKMYALFDSGLVVQTYLDFKADDAMAVLTRAWGPPDKEPDRDDPSDVAWRSTTTGWRAAANCSKPGDKEPGCSISFHPHLPLDQMFTTPIAPPGELAKVKPRATLAELKATTKLAVLTDEPVQTPMRYLDFDGAVEHLGIVDGRLFSLDEVIPASARPALEKAWGPPAIPGKHAMWFDAKSGWSVTVDEDLSDAKRLRVDYQGYQPFLDEVALLEKLTAAPTAADAKRSHPDLDWDPTIKNDDQPSLLLSDNEFVEPGFRAMRLLPIGFFGNSKAVSAVMGQLDPAREAAIVDALTVKWGAPKKTTLNDGVVEYRFAKHGLLMHEASMLAVHVGSDS